MYSSRIAGVITVIVLTGLGLGGCPLADDLSQDAAVLDETESLAEDTTEEDTATQASMLNDLASQMVADAEAEEYAWSEGSTTISIDPDTDTEGRSNSGLDSGTDSEDTAGDGDDDGDETIDNSDNTGDGDDGDDDSGDDPSNEPTGGSGPSTYLGNIQCAYRESLWDDEQFYGEITDDVTYEQTITFDEDGVPDAIPVHPFVTSSHTERFETTARFAGESETFTYDEGTPDFAVTVYVVSATYTPLAAHVELEIDFSWIGGGGTSIVAAGTHSLDTQVAGNDVTYTAYTAYEGVFTAANDWVGYGTTEYDCSGTLAEQ